MRKLAAIGVFSFRFHKASSLCNFAWKRGSHHVTANNCPNRLLTKRPSCIYNVTVRQLSSDQPVLDEHELRKQINILTDSFLEARELLVDAEEVKDTVYFSADIEEAEEAVTETLEAYEKLLSQLTEAQKTNVCRTIGLKMQELKAHQNAIREYLVDH
ncbi:uncharacterized protein LOC144435861 [Glandiceps talaboti]